MSEVRILAYPGLTCLDNSETLAVDAVYIDSVISGLKNLYEELVSEDNDNEMNKTYIEVFAIIIIFSNLSTTYSRTSGLRTREVKLFRA